MENTEHTEGQGVNRRSFIKRAAATGGVVVFAAPAIQTVVAGAARASTGASGPPPQGNCCHSDPTDTNAFGCKPACTQAGSALGGPCSDICNAACPVGQGDCNPCSSDDYCDPNCYTSSGHGQVEFVC